MLKDSGLIGDAESDIRNVSLHCHVICALIYDIRIGNKYVRSESSGVRSLAMSMAQSKYNRNASIQYYQHLRDGTIQNSVILRDKEVLTEVLIKIEM
jgi:hypothetical protein